MHLQDRPEDVLLRSFEPYMERDTWGQIRALIEQRAYITLRYIEPVGQFHFITIEDV
jgi:hypothetical protein